MSKPHKFAVHQKIRTNVEGEPVEYGYVHEQKHLPGWLTPQYSIMLDKYWTGCENEFDPVPSLHYHELELEATE